MRLDVLRLALIAALLVPTLSFAQDAPTPEQRQAAREAYGRGQSLYREGSYEESVAAFEEAYALIPNPVVLLGIAESKERMGDAVGTVQALERYLADRADAPDRAEIEARLERLRATPATLVITSVPEGAAISLDGADSGETTPAELEVAPGPHSIALTAEGYEASEQEVEATFGTRHEVEATLTELAPVEAEAGGMNGEGEGIDEAEGEESEDSDTADDGPGAAVWVTTGLAAATLVGGTVLGFMSLSREAEFDDEPDEDTADQGERFALFADVLFGVAAVSAITAIVLFLTDKDAEDEDDEEESVSLQVAPVVTPRSGGVTAQLRF